MIGTNSTPGSREGPSSSSLSCYVVKKRRWSSSCSSTSSTSSTTTSTKNSIKLKKSSNFTKFWTQLQAGGGPGVKPSSTTTKLHEFAEDKCVQLPFIQDKVELPSSVRSTFLMVFSPDGEKVASTHGDHKIYISQLRTGKVIQTLEGHPQTPWCLAFHPSLKDVIASGCLAGEVRVWDLRSGACEVWVNSHGSVIASVAFHPLDHVILIATCNELHFWDWRQSNVPFLSLTTATDKERVRFVKFDSRGTKIITGISNVSPTNYHHPPPFHRSNASASLLSQPSHSSTSHSFNFAPILYRSNDPAQESPSTSSSSGSLSPPLAESSSTHPPLLEHSRSLFEDPPIPLPRRSSLLSRLSLMSRHLEPFDEPTPYEPPTRSLIQNFQPSQPSTSSSSSPQPGLSRESSPSPLSMPSTSSSSNPVAEYSQSLISTFRRLNSLCNRLAQLMQEQQTSSRLMEGERDVRSTEASSSLSDLLSRLQQSLQNMSTAALTTTIAQEHIQQVRQRVSEILERLVSVSGYRARLSSLRDQIYEVAERYAAGDGLAGSQGWDLLHCLWLVDMSIHLTRQMQRILAADYRLTQITLSNATQQQQSGPSTSRGPPLPPPLLGHHDYPLIPDETNTSSARVRSFHPYQRWTSSQNFMSRSRSSSSSSTDSFSIPLVRVSGPEDASSPSDDQPEHIFVREAFSRQRPRSPPLPEIQQVLSGSASSGSSRVNLRMSENNNAPTAAGPRVPHSHPLANLPSHIWFNAGTLPWPAMAGELSGQGGGYFGNGPTLPCSLSYRLQCWDFSNYSLPNLRDSQMNVVVSKCRIHNDASVDMNPEGTLLAALVPIENSSSINLCIYSLEVRNFAQCLYLWTFGGHAISVSLSPLSRYVVVGLTSPRSLIDTFSSIEDVTIGQVFQLKESSTLDDDTSCPSQCLQHVRNINVSRDIDDSNFVTSYHNFSLNSLRWIPHAGGGFVYGTNRGHLVICRPKRGENRDEVLIKSLLTNRTTTGTQTILSTTSNRLISHSRSSSIGTQTSSSSISSPLSTSAASSENNISRIDSDTE